MMKRSFAHKLFPLLALLLLPAACKMSSQNPITKPVDKFFGYHGETEARLSTAAAAAVAQGKTDEALAQYKELYAKKPRDADVALNYAQLLRKTGQPEVAEVVLQPFVERSNGIPLRDADPLVITEFAASLIAQGKFDHAEKELNRVLEDKNAEKFRNDAYNLTAISLDARGEHRQAEQMFRQALDGWKGDPTSVMNNLGLCLAAEGNFDEALTTLRRALVMAPQKEEIARNIEIVEKLRDKVVARAPDKKKKK